MIPNLMDAAELARTLSSGRHFSIMLLIEPEGVKVATQVQAESELEPLSFLVKWQDFFVREGQPLHEAIRLVEHYMTEQWRRSGKRVPAGHAG